MEMKFLSGREFSSITKGVRMENGEWHVEVDMTETVHYPNGTSRTEVIEGYARHEDFNEAHKAALRDVLQELQDLVYSRGFDSLIEGIDYQKSLEAGNGEAEPDKTAPAE